MATDYDKINRMISKTIKKPKKTQSEKNAKSIENKKTRLGAIGVNADESLDNRNFIEKALNLPDGQNIIFDIFEILNRPQQGIFGGVKALQEGGNFTEGFSKGITGEEETQFKEILKNIGMSDREGKLDLVDVLGFAGDVFLDPIDLIPVAGFSKFADLKTAEKGILEGLEQAGKNADDIAKVRKVLSREARRSLKSTSDIIGQYAGKAIKAGAKGADNIIEAGLRSVDSLRGIEYGNKAAKYASDLGKTVLKADSDPLALLELYKGLKNSISTKFGTLMSKGARLTKRKLEGNEFITRAILEAKLGELNDKIVPIAEMLNVDVGEVYTDLVRINDMDFSSKIDIESVLREGAKGHIKWTKSTENALKALVEDVGDDVLRETLLSTIKKGDNGVLQLGDEWLDLIQNGSYSDLFDPEKLQKTVNRASWLTPEAQKEIKNLKKMYKTLDPEILNIIPNFYNDANRTIEAYFPIMQGLEDNYYKMNELGYVRHQVNPDYNESLKTLVRDFGVDDSVLNDQIIRGAGGTPQPTNTKFLESRWYNLPAEEANLLKKRELLSIEGLSDSAKKFIENDIDLFDATGRSSINSYIDNMPRLAKNTSMFEEILIKQGLDANTGNLTKINELQSQIKNLRKAGDIKGADAAVDSLNNLLSETPLRIVTASNPKPKDMVILSRDEIEKIQDTFNNIARKTGNADLKTYSDLLENAGTIAIDPTVKRILNLKDNNEAMGALGQIYNNLLNYFKGNKTSSFTNQANNIIGNLHNMWLSGVGVDEMLPYINDAIKDLYTEGGWQQLLQDGFMGRIPVGDKRRKAFDEIWSFIRDVGVPTEENIAKIRDLDEIVNLAKKEGSKLPLDKVRQTFAKLNTDEDRLFRYALYKYAKDHPNYIKDLGVNTAGEAVLKALFDPENLTAFEQDRMRKIIPFYTFAKNNLAYHIDNMQRHLSKYNKTVRTYKNLIKNTVGADEETIKNIPDYLKDNMYLPIPTGKNKDGSYNFTRVTLPMSDIIELTDPVGAFKSRSNSLLKLPFELSQNKNFFTGRDIEKYTGEKSDLFPLNILGGTKRQEHILSNTLGIDVPLQQGQRVYQDIADMLQGNGYPMKNVLTINRNISDDALARQYEQIDQLEDIIKQYKARGYVVPTIKELEKANENKKLKKAQARLDAILNKYK